MAVIQRRIDGPQDFHEQRGGIAYRDTRTVGVHLKEALTTGASAIGLVGMAATVFAAPALTTVIVPLALAYAGYVMTRPITMPLRLPADTRRKDYGNPVPDPKRLGVQRPGPAKGDWFLGWDDTTGQQIWLAGEDMTMHAVLPGATGSGKTQFIYSLLCNALAQGSGFTIVDAKGSNNLVFSVAALLQRWGMGANLRIINLIVSDGDRKTNTWNPFGSVNAEGMTELLLTLFLPEDENGGGNSQHFKDRADALIRSMAHVFVWLRDHCGIPVTAETIRANFSDIQSLIDLTRSPDHSNAQRRFHFYNDTAGKIETIPLPPEFPAQLLNPVRAYVAETGGYSSEKGDASGQDKVREQHSYVVGGFARTFTQMTTTLRHIFQCAVPDIDFRDIIFNRRVLVVLIPSLENSTATNAALGKTIITALRYALAGALGTSLEGSYEDLVTNRPSASPTPYPIIIDEGGYIATRGLDVMMAQGRELNISLLLSFQEVGSFYATLGRDRSVPLLGNPKLKIIENLEDSGPTREWIEQTAGTMQVSVLPGYDTSAALGVYTDQTRADIREVKRVSWSDVQSLQQGQAIVLFRGKRIYTRLFYAGVKPSGVNRVFPMLSLARPSRTAPAITSGKAPDPDAAIREHLVAGDDIVTASRLPALPGSLGVVFDRLATIIEVQATPSEDVQELFGSGMPSVPAAPYACLFQNLPTPYPRRHDAAVNLIDPEINRALFETMVAFEIRMGAPEAQARNAVATALNAAAGSPAQK